MIVCIINVSLEDCVLELNPFLTQGTFFVSACTLMLIQLLPAPNVSWPSGTTPAPPPASGLLQTLNQNPGTVKHFVIANVANPISSLLWCYRFVFIVKWIWWQTITLFRCIEELFFPLTSPFLIYHASVLKQLIYPQVSYLWIDSPSSLWT